MGLTLKVRWNRGVEVESSESILILDPTVYDPSYEYALITHAHSDHSKGLYCPFSIKCSTEETVRLAEVYRSTMGEGWRRVRCGDRFRLGEFEVRVHNAGHVLGSVYYEVVSGNGETLVYTGDLNTVKTLTMEAAKPTSCDVLVIDATFGSPAFIFPSREELSVEVSKWSIDSLREGKVPVFQTDSIGNAQEIISMLNTMTNIPVVTHPRISGVNKVYESSGHRLEYIDLRSADASELLSRRACTLILPKRGRLPSGVKANLALASGWALYLKDGRKPIPLSDHADFNGLLEFIEGCKPKLVLTFHGGRRGRVLAEYVKKRLGVEARPIEFCESVFPETKGKDRLRACEKEVLRTVRIRGFLYKFRWIYQNLKAKGFSKSEVERALESLVDTGKLEVHGREDVFKVK